MGLPMNIASESCGPNRKLFCVWLMAGVPMLIFIGYLIMTVLTYRYWKKGYSGFTKHRKTDAFYFSVVTLCTIGYGDIVPINVASKIFQCVFVLLGTVLMDVFISWTVCCGCIWGNQNNRREQRCKHNTCNYVLDHLIEFSLICKRMRTKWKIGLWFAFVVICILGGVFALHYIEKLGWVDAVYVSIMSITTVGYGDKGFKTQGGRVIATIWLFTSTLAMGRLFMTKQQYFLKLDKKFAEEELKKKLSIEDMKLADLDNHGYVSKLEFALYKLKKMQKVKEEDIQQILEQFNELDPDQTGQIPYFDTQRNDGVSGLPDTILTTLHETKEEEVGPTSGISQASHQESATEIRVIEMENITDQQPT